MPFPWLETLSTYAVTLEFRNLDAVEGALGSSGGGWRRSKYFVGRIVTGLVISFTLYVEIEIVLREGARQGRKD